MEELIATLEFYFTKGLDPATIKKLIEKYSSSKTVLETDYDTLKNDFGESVAKIVTQREASCRILAEKKLEKADKFDVKLVPLSSKDYPFY